MDETLANPHSLEAWLDMFIRALSSTQFWTVMAVFGVYLGYDALHKGWRQSFSKRMLFNSLTSLGFKFGNVLFIPMIYFAIGWVQTGYQMLNIPHISVDFWSAIPVWLLIVLTIYTKDFVDYWNHRIMHTSFLWPIHAIHHSDTEVNALTTYRVHFLEAGFMFLTHVLFLSWLGFPPYAVAIAAFILIVHNAYSHIDMDWDHGPLKYLIASPRFHRWHHVNEERAHGKNLANFTPLYDVIFKTYYNPHPCPKNMGVDDVPDTDIIALMMYPFTELIKGIKNMFSPSTAKNKAPVDPAE